MRTKLLIAFIAAMLTIPSAAFATDSDVRSDQSDQAVDVVQTDDRAKEQDTRPETVRPPETDEPTRRCLDADKVTDRCCLHFADENPERCRDHLCKDTDALTDRCCHYFADEHPERCRDHTCDETDRVTDRCCLYVANDHPERCRDDEVDTPNYRKLFWRLFKAGEWQLIIRLLEHLAII